LKDDFPFASSVYYTNLWFQVYLIMAIALQPRCIQLRKVMRILQVPRRDYAVAVQRNAFKNRGPLYSDKAITMRCARPDQSTQTVWERERGYAGGVLEEQ